MTGNSLHRLIICRLADRKGQVTMTLNMRGCSVHVDRNRYWTYNCFIGCIYCLIGSFTSRAMIGVWFVYTASANAADTHAGLSET